MPSEVFEAFTVNTGCNQDCLNGFNNTLTSITSNKQTKDAVFGSQVTTTKLNSINADLRVIGAGPTAQGYTTAVTNFTENLGEIQNLIDSYNQDVVKRSSDLLKQMTTALNINNQVAALDQIVSSASEAKNDMLEAQESLSTAYTREAALDTKDDAISYQQAWGYIARPLKRNSIPILIVLSLLFFGLGIVGLWFVSPYAAAVQSISSGEIGFFQHPAVWMTMVIVVVISLILGALKLGKQI